MRTALLCVKYFVKSSVFNEYVLKGLKRSTSFRKTFGGFRKIYYFCKRV